MTKVTLSYSAKVLNFAALEVALKTGEFAKTHLTVTLAQDPNGLASEPQELSQGLVQMSEGGVAAAVLNAEASGIPIVGVGESNFLPPTTLTGLWVNTRFLNPDGTFKKSLASTFVFSTGTAGLAGSSGPEVNLWLERSGVSAAQVKVADIPNPTLAQALLSGHLGGATLVSPEWQPLKGNPTFKDVSPVWPTSQYIMYKPWLDSHKAVAQAIVRSIVRTDRTYLAKGWQKSAKVVGIISTWLGLPSATVAGEAPLIFSQDLDPHFLKTVTLKLQQAWLQLGGVLDYAKPLKAKQLVDLTLVKSVDGA